MNKKIRRYLMCLMLISCSIASVGCTNNTENNLVNLERQVSVLQNKVETIQSELDTLKKHNNDLKAQIDGVEDDSIRFYNLKTNVGINVNKNNDVLHYLELEYEFDNKTGKTINTIVGEVAIIQGTKSIITEIVTFDDVNLDTGRNTVVVSSVNTEDYYASIPVGGSKNYNIGIDNIRVEFTPITLVFGDGSVLSQ